MRIDRNVYILGAGFSRAANLPLIDKFFQRSREIYDNPDSKLEKHLEDDFRKVLDFRKEISMSREKVNIDLDNIEHLFSLADIAEIGTSGTKNDLEVAIKRMIIKTLQYCQKSPPELSISALFHGFSPDKIRPHTAKIAELQKKRGKNTDCYELFAMMTCGKLEDRPEHKKDTIISFNYDLVMEEYYKSIGIYPDYAIERYSNDERSKAGLEKGPRLLKLHGSSNWGNYGWQIACI